MSRSALIIANWQYEDPWLRALIAPSQDAESLGAVLRDPAIGDFEVTVLSNEPSYRICEQTETFFGDRERDDLLVLFFSGHGVTDDDGQLYYAAPNTRHNRLRSTSVAASWVNDIMNQCRSRRQVLLLDCCHSGAFARTKGSASVNVGKYFTGSTPEEGRGKFILTASDAFQYSFEGDAVEGAGVRSVFTEALVEGLRSGAADTDGDGKITLDELYAFVHKRVRDRTAQQTPKKWASDAEGSFVIAFNPAPCEVPLPEDLQFAIDSDFPAVRENAIPRIEKLLYGVHRGRALSAHKALLGLINDDSRRVASSAEKCLLAYKEAQAEAERPEREKAEAARVAEERAVAERKAKAEAEAERLEREKAEAARLAEERAKAERKAKAQAEAERLAREKEKAERLAQQQAEAERRAQTQPEDGRVEEAPVSVVTVRRGLWKDSAPWVGAVALAVSIGAIVVVNYASKSSSPGSQSEPLSVPTPRESAASNYRRGCDGGDATACTNLGYAYENGNDVTKDYAQAASSYRKGCDGGNASGCTHLGLLYERAEGVTKDNAQAASFYRKGCDGGDAWGCTDLGISYDNGDIVTKDYVQAVSFYQKGCDGGNATGCAKLGLAYEYGNGVTKDQAKADSFYRKGCDGGEASGCTNLGLAYENGKGITKDYAQAASFYQKGCDGGNATGCGYLGFLYVQGSGVATDTEKGTALLRKACSDRNQWSCDYLKTLKK